MKSREEFKVVKIPLEMFINLLVALYEEGANYIDLSSEVNEEEKRETIKISIQDDYYEEEEDEDNEAPRANIKLSDDDIDKLI